MTNPTMITKKLLVTPELAENYLVSNTSNRRVRPGHVQDLARSMSTGQWKLTHQGIAFGNNNELIDGQHRLLAVVQSNTPVWMQVTFGADSETFGLIDIGTKRDSGDVLKIPKKQAELVRMVARTVFGGGVPSYQELSSVWAVIQEPVETLHTFCPSHSAIFGSVAIRLAAITCMMQGESRDYVLNLYSNLINAKIAELPPIGQSILGQVVRGNLTAFDKVDLLARGMVIFRKCNANTTRLQIVNAESATTQVRNFFRPLVEAQKEAA